MTTFSAQVGNWVKQSERRLEAVFKESTQRVISEAQRPVAQGGNLPVDTGYLRSSLLASTSSMPQIRADATGGTGGDPSGQIALVINSARLGQTLYAGYTASYASHVHYGARGRPARLWVTLAAQRWEAIVNEVVAELRSRSA